MPQAAVALLNHVAKMDADSKLNAALGRQASVALDHAVLHLDGAAHRIYNASELLVGDLVGSGEAQERGIVGETPNVAARLQGGAEQNTIVIAQKHAEATRHLFEFEAARV
jgi:class 3 adenylate cyclase